MEIAKDYLERFSVSKGPKSERSDLLQKFLDVLKDKNGKSFRPAFVAMKLSHVQTPDLYFLLKKCEEANNFGAMFWYLIKAKDKLHKI